VKNVSFHQIIKRYLIFLTTVPILFFGVYIYAAHTLRYNESIDRLVYSNFDMIESKIIGFTDANSKMLTLFANNESIQQAFYPALSAEKINSVISKFDSANGSSGNFMLGLSNGEIFIKNRHLLPKKFDPRERPWYIDTFSSNGSVVVSEPYRDAFDSNNFVITFSKGIYSDDGQYIGVAGLDVDLSDILSYDDESFPDGSIFLLVDKKGTILSKTQKQFLDYALNLEDASIEIDKKSETKRILRLKDKNFYLFNGNSTANGWRILAFIPQTSFLNYYGDILFLTMMIVSLMIFISAFYSKKIESALSKPVDNLVEQLEAIDLDGEDQLINSFENQTQEIEIVMAATNRMLKRIYEQNENLNDKQDEITNQYMEIEALYEETNAINSTLSETVDALNESWIQTIRVLSNVIEANDVYTRGHCDRVTQYAVSIAKSMNLDSVTIRDIEFAALLHDVGKVGIPYHIINKPGALTDEEYGYIKNHPVIGYRIIESIPFLNNTAKIILSHHEKVDGTGYPENRENIEISLESKILTVADSFDAMTSARPYRRVPMTWQEALVELDTFSGTQFDPLIVDVFKECVKVGSINDNY